MVAQKKRLLRRNRRKNSSTRYYNLGWFGQHLWMYELGSMLISPIRKRAVKAVPIGKKLKILDIACGTGANSYVLARQGHEVCGVDLDKEMLNWAKKKHQETPNLSFLHGDATQLEFDDGSFDAVTISFAIHDVPFEIGKKILSEVKRVLVPGGEVIIIDYNEPGRNFAAKLLCWIALLYESPNFGEFIKVGVAKYLEDSGLTVVGRFTILGVIQVVSSK